MTGRQERMGMGGSGIKVQGNPATLHYSSVIIEMFFFVLH